MITQDQLKEVLHYCPETGVFTWLKMRKGQTAGYLIRKQEGKHYLQIRIRKDRYLAHRLAFLYMTGSFPTEQVDHINGCGTDNRWNNLRDVPSSANTKNRRLPCTNKSGAMGVRWCAASSRWLAQISDKGKQIHLGTFILKEDAVAVRRLAESELGYHPNHGTERPL